MTENGYGWGHFHCKNRWNFFFEIMVEFGTYLKCQELFDFWTTFKKDICNENRSSCCLTDVLSVMNLEWFSLKFYYPITLLNSWSFFFFFFVFFAIFSNIFMRIIFIFFGNPLMHIICVHKEPKANLINILSIFKVYFQVKIE